MDEAGPAAFRAWPHVKSVSNIAATAIVTDHAWSQNLDSGDVDEGYPQLCVGAGERTPALIFASTYQLILKTGALSNVARPFRGHLD